MLCCAQSHPILCDPMDYIPPGSSVHGDSPGKNIGVDCHAFLQGIFPTKGLNLKPAVQAGSLLFEPPGKPVNTGVHSLTLLQSIVLTQESNWGLLHCRHILYQLSYQGSPTSFILICSFHTFCNVSLITRKKTSKKCEV